MAKRIIVDENDKIIGAKEKTEITNEDIYRVSSLLIENTKGELLLSLRSKNKKPENNPGKWSPSVNGTVEVGESYYSNLVKEIEEELGITNLKLVKLGKILVNDKTNFFVETYKATSDINIKDLRLKEDEVEEVKWFAKKEIKQLLQTNPEIFVPEFKKVTKDYL